jgi:hypothetical protein
MALLDVLLFRFTNAIGAGGDNVAANWLIVLPAVSNSQQCASTPNLAHFPVYTVGGNSPEIYMSCECVCVCVFENAYCWTVD